jgi:hypothetical protein
MINPSDTTSCVNALPRTAGLVVAFSVKGMVDKSTSVWDSLLAEGNAGSKANGHPCRRSAVES